MFVVSVTMLLNISAQCDFRNRVYAQVIGSYDTDGLSPTNVKMTFKIGRS